MDVISATSVELSWLPPDPQLWNGVITNYTVVYKLLGPVGMTPAEIVTTMIKAIPTPGNPLANNPDPRHATAPLRWEMVVLDDLQEYHVYEFSVFIENAAGRSEMSMAIMQGLPGAGRFHNTPKRGIYTICFILDNSYLSLRNYVFCMYLFAPCTRVPVTRTLTNVSYRIPILQNHPELRLQFRFESSPQLLLKCSGNPLTSLIRMVSLQDTHLCSSKMGLVPPMSTIRLAMLLLNTLKVNSYIGNICKLKAIAITIIMFNQFSYVHHGMQVYKNTHGTMQGLLHQLNTEEVYCLTGLTFRPSRIVSALYAGISDTNNVLSIERKIV